jgi:hypothetical protein
VHVLRVAVVHVRSRTLQLHNSNNHHTWGNCDSYFSIVAAAKPSVLAWQKSQVAMMSFFADSCMIFLPTTPLALPSTLLCQATRQQKHHYKTGVVRLHLSDSISNGLAGSSLFASTSNSFRVCPAYCTESLSGAA